MKKKILVFTGAGVSAESGIETFRSKDGLWNNHKVEEVATIEGWNEDINKVLNFYNERRRQLKQVNPNTAHKIIADLERYFEVTVVTQNVDNLHEEAGSTKVIHLHGELNKVRSTIDSTLVYDWFEDCNVGDKCERGSQLRPHIVWFGEQLNYKLIDRALEAAIEADFCIIVGTSMQVAPANQIPFLTKSNTTIWLVDPEDIEIDIELERKSFFTHLKMNATDGMKFIEGELLKLN